MKTLIVLLLNSLALVFACTACAQTEWCNVDVFKVEAEGEISLMPVQKLCRKGACGAFLDVSSSPPIPVIVQPTHGQFASIAAPAPKDRAKKADLIEKYERIDDHAGQSWPLMQVTGEVYLARLTEHPFKRIKVVHSFEGFELVAVGCTAHEGSVPVVYGRHAKAGDTIVTQYIGLVTVGTGELHEISTVPVEFASSISWLGADHLALFGSWRRGNNWAVLGLNGKVLKMGETQRSPAWLLQENGTLSSINAGSGPTSSIQVIRLFGKDA